MTRTFTTLTVCSLRSAPRNPTTDNRKAVNGIDLARRPRPLCLALPTICSIPAIFTLLRRLCWCGLLLGRLRSLRSLRVPCRRRRLISALISRPPRRGRGATGRVLWLLLPSGGGCVRSRLVLRWLWRAGRTRRGRAARVLLRLLRWLLRLLLFTSRGRARVWSLS